ncbi:AMP-binding protein [Candidatus Sumerlaeota bacterium]|nr:AMP-binding protein [Candidatus Sumerlaeota bacterium]
MDLKRALYKVWTKNPNAACVVDEDRRYSFDQIVRRAVALSPLIALNDRSDTGHVAIVLPNSEAFVTVFLGCLAADRAGVPINYLMTPPEVADILAHSQAHLVITASPFRPLMEAVCQRLGGQIQPFYFDELLANLGQQQIDAAVALAAPAALESGASDPDRTACVIYTSGTTGLCKGVVLSHHNLLSNCEGMRQVLDVLPSDVFLTVLPLFHSFGLSTAMLLPLLSGSTMVLMRRFHPVTAADLIEREKVTALLMVPSMFALLMRAAASNPSRLSSVRLAISGGAALPMSLADAFEQRIGFPLFQGYGLTETSPVVAANHPGARRWGSVGQTLPDVRVEIRDDDGRPLPSGQVGEICIHGPNVMRGYFRNPDATAQAIDPNGWLRTGDLGYLDADGFLFVTGRKKDMIIFGGEKIFPQEVEHVLLSHPAVAEAVVIGVSDPLAGERPKAFVVLNEGATFDERSLRQWCAQRLAGFKIPREFQVVAELPKNPIGKILRRELTKSA